MCWKLKLVSQSEDHIEPDKWEARLSLWSVHKGQVLSPGSGNQVREAGDEAGLHPAEAALDTTSHSTHSGHNP